MIAMGSRSKTIYGALMLISLVCHCKIVHGVEYTVGDALGWRINVENWTKGKTFRPGDGLTFKYDPKLHNVVKSTLYSYDTCTVGSNSTIFQTGNDHIKLQMGPNFFFSSIGEDCNNKMKIEVRALPPPPEE